MVGLGNAVRIGERRRTEGTTTKGTKYTKGGNHADMGSSALVAKGGGQGISPITDKRQRLW